jgi:hypothetical protein
VGEAHGIAGDEGEVGGGGRRARLRGDFGGGRPNGEHHRRRDPDEGDQRGEASEGAKHGNLV